MFASDPLLYGAGIFGVGYTLIVLVISATAHREVLARFFGWAGPYFVIPALGFAVLLLGFSTPDAFLLFVLAELAYTIFVFRGYVRGLIGRTSPRRPWAAGALLLGAFQPYVAASLTIVSIYLSFTVTASLLQRIFVDRRGSFTIVASFLFLSTSLVSEAFFELQGYPVFFEAGALAFLFSVVVFELPLAVSIPFSTVVEPSEPAPPPRASPAGRR